MESNLHRRLRTEIDFGMGMAADPDNANLPDLAIRITTLDSLWYARVCPVCQDKFRERDQVRLCPRCGRAYHDDGQYDLHCWQRHFAVGKNRCAAAGPYRFGDSESALPDCDYVWDGRLSKDSDHARLQCKDHLSCRSPAQSLVRQFVAGVEATWRAFGEENVQEASADNGLAGLKCPWCRFRIRVGDRVVRCPCGSDCGTYFHQDVFRHLTCWNEWNGGRGSDHCPTTGAPLRKRVALREDNSDGQ